MCNKLSKTQMKTSKDSDNITLIRGGKVNFQNKRAVCLQKLSPSELSGFLSLHATGITFKQTTDPSQ